MSHLARVVYFADTLGSVADLWKLALVVVVGVLGVAYRKPLGAALERLTTFKLRRGETELATSHEGSREASQVPDEEAVKPGELERPDETEPSLDADPVSEGSGIGTQRALLDAVRSGDTEKAEELYRRLVDSEASKVEKLRAQGFYAFLRFNFAGDQDALGELEKLASEEALAGWVYFRIGLSLEWGRDFIAAADAFARAADQASSPKEGVGAVTHQAACLQKAGRTEDAIETIVRRLGDTTHDRSSRAQLYGSLAERFGASGDHEMEALAAELALEAQPNDVELLFTAAYAYSRQETRGDVLALVHYTTLLSYEPDHSASLNNVGVQYDRFEMPIRSVRRYREAVEHDNSLAMANLAYRLMDSGFSDEAGELLDRARALDNPHPNVGSAIARRSEREQSEMETHTKLLNAGREMQQFLRAFAKAYFVPQEHGLEGKSAWRDGDGAAVEVGLANGRVEVTWASGKRRLEGALHNRGMRGTNFEEKFSLSASERRLEETGTGLLYIVDGDEIQVMVSEGATPTYIDLRASREAAKPALHESGREGGLQSDAPQP